MHPFTSPCSANQRRTPVTFSSPNPTIGTRTHPTNPFTATQTKTSIFWLHFLSISCSWYKIHSTACRHFTVNSTNNRTVLNTTVLSCPLRHQKSVYWLSIIPLCPSEWSDFHFTLAKNKSTQSLDATRFNPTQPMDGPNPCPSLTQTDRYTPVATSLKPSKRHAANIRLAVVFRHTCNPIRIRHINKVLTRTLRWQNSRSHGRSNWWINRFIQPLDNCIAA